MADDTQDTPAMGAMQDVLDLAEVMQHGWEQHLQNLRTSGVPLMAGDADSGGGDAGDGDGADAGSDGQDGGNTGDGTDQQLGDAGKKALEQERAARREAEKEARETKARLRAIEDQGKSDGEKLTEAEQRAVKAENRLARVNAAIKKKLPLDLADRLIGDTAEELERDAERLAKQLVPANGGGFDQGARGGGQPSDMDSLIRRAAGRA